MSKITDSDIMKNLMVNMDNNDVHILFARAFEILFESDSPLLGVLQSAGCIGLEEGALMINYDKLSKFFEENMSKHGKPIKYEIEKPSVFVLQGSDTINWNYLYYYKTGELFSPVFFNYILFFIFISHHISKTKIILF